MKNCMRRITAIGIIGFALVLTGCAVTQDLDATNWNLIEYRNSDGDLVKTIPQSTVTADFQSEKVSGIAGCNNYSASYTVEGKKVSFSVPLSTRKMCSEPDGLMSQEFDFLSNLPLVSEYEMKDDTLNFLDSKGEAVLTFMRK